MMSTTFFAPAERISGDELQSQMDFVSQNPVMTSMLSIVGGLLAVLNEQRQLLALNQKLLQKIGVIDPAEVLGLRPGEALQCVFAEQAPAGCGTGRMCASCGAAIAIVTSLAKNKPVERMCALKAHQGESTVDLFLLVRAQPLIIDGHRLLLLFLQDNTLQQHWQTMEQVFFHDTTNLLTGLIGASELMVKIASPEQRGYAQNVHDLAMRLSKEVQIQKLLAHPDRRNYHLAATHTTCSSILAQTRELFSYHPLARDKALTFVAASPERKLWTDPYILVRVLSNMITNALEASKPGEEVRVTAELQGSHITFSVWNRQYIAPYIAGRIFQRNFSTKREAGHGLGTYSMKLFGETILGGKVAFETSEKDGTTFFIQLPLDYTES